MHCVGSDEEDSQHDMSEVVIGQQWEVRIPRQVVAALIRYDRQLDRFQGMSVRL
jgi:hypothetical protein